MAKYRERRETYIVFIDLEKVYNKVLGVLCQCLEAKGVHVTYIRVIKDMDDRAKSRMRKMGLRGDSNHFQP